VTYANGTEARQSLTRYFAFYNERRGARGPVLDYATPDEAYFSKLLTATI
jgi:hypothetical protein